MLKSPYPYFGGKSRVAPEVWQRFGEPKNYVEPFLGSAAVLLANPNQPLPIETVNDADHFIANFFRAIEVDPDVVAHYADSPTSEIELYSRHEYLKSLTKETSFKDMIAQSPFYYDTRIAGWWAWGLCNWIGGGWGVKNSKQIPYLSGVGMGFRSKAERDDIAGYFQKLSVRFRDVRVLCGDFERCLKPSVTTRHGLTAVFLDPPYSEKAGRYPELYAVDRVDVAHRSAKWAVEHGDDPLLRIAFCGYDTEHIFPESWSVYQWKANGGYGSQADGVARANARRETIWFSPYCLPERIADCLL